MHHLIGIIISFVDPNLDGEEIDEEVLNLLGQLKALDEIERVSRVPDPSPPQGSLAGTGFLLGLLQAEVNVENAKRVLSFLGDRLSGKVIKIKVKIDNNEVEVEANSKEELKLAIEQLKGIAESLKSSK